MKKNYVYVESFPYYTTISIAIFLNTLVVFFAYHMGWLGIVWENTNNIALSFVISFFFFPQDLLFLIGLLPAAYTIWKRRKSKIEVISLNDFRRLGIAILFVLSILIVFLFLNREKGTSIFLAFILLFYLPLFVQLFFIERNKKAVETTSPNTCFTER